jgi:sn1-specific diacylglycerol lipase
VLSNFVMQRSAREHRFAGSPLAFGTTIVQGALLRHVDGMPALVMCGRRWLNGSDDFVFQGFGVSFFHATLAITAYSLLYNGRLNADSEHSAHCPGTSDALSGSVLALLVVNITGALAFWLLGFASLRGRILEPSKRRMVPIILFVCALVTLADVIATSVAMHYGYRRHEINLCPRKVFHGLQYLIIGNIIVWVYLAISWLLKYDPMGNRNHAQLRESEEEYLNMWRVRCGLLTACCCCTFQTDEKHDIMEDVTLTMARLFDAHDIVLSDISAGLILLHRHQRRQQQLLLRRTREQAGGHAEELLAQQGLALAKQAQMFHPLTASDKSDLQKLQHFSKYYLAAYGYLLFWFQNLCSGPMRLCLNDCITCCRRRKEDLPRSGDCCYCNLNALRMVALIDNDDDVLLTSFENQVLMPAFYVAVDHSTNSVVVAIRGSMSLHDAITDVVAQPKALIVTDIEAAGTGPCYVHGGMLRCAEKILAKLTRRGIIDLLVSGKYSGHSLVVVGHSLGAGVATMLAIRLRDKFPELRPRLQAFAYAPPGALMTKQLSEYTDSFITCAFMGKDLVPRLTAHTMNDLRDSLFLAIAASRRSKAYVVGNACCPGMCPLMALPEKLEVSEEELRIMMDMIRPTADMDPVAQAVATKTSAQPKAHNTVTAAIDQRREQANDQVERAQNQLQAQQQQQQPAAASQPFPSRDERQSSPAGATAVTITPLVASSPLRASASRSFSSAAAVAADARQPTSPAGGQPLPPGAPQPPPPPPDLHLFPPNRMYHFVKAAERSGCCAFACGIPGVSGCCKSYEYWPRLTSPEELQEVVVSPLMVADHLPDRLYYVLQNGCTNVDEQRLQPLVSETAFRPGPPGAASNQAAGSSAAHLCMLYRPNVDVIRTGYRSGSPLYGTA